MKSKLMCEVCDYVWTLLDILDNDKRFLIGGSGDLRPAEGYFTIVNAASGMIELKMPFIKTVSPEKSSKYCFNSEEKPLRLYHMHLNAGHLSSYQSRDEKAGMWGGAIVAGEWILSFSGLPEKTDEALMLLLAVKQRFITMETACMIAELSQNEAFKTMAPKILACHC